jgi:ABC-type multidrug transport system fused ATPase/permease subunit
LLKFFFQLIDRTIPIAMDEQILNLGSLTNKTVKENMAEDHIWWSIFARPVKSNYTRVQRVTCAFVFIYMIMLFHMLYFELDYEARNPNDKYSLRFGFFSLAPKQLYIGFIIVLLTIIPTVLIIEIFRRARSRQKIRTERLKDVIEDSNALNLLRLKKNKKIVVEEEALKTNEFKLRDNKMIAKHGKTKSIFQFTLPWWFSIIGFIISWSVMLICIFFVIVKGLEYGNKMVEKWIVQFIISIFTSIFITEPLKVIFFTFVFVLLCRRRIDNFNVDTNADDTENSLNQNEEWLYSLKDKSYRRENYVNKLKLSLSPHEVKVAKQNRIKNVTIQSIIREILVYISFLWILYVVTYSNAARSSYSYQTSLKRQFVDPFVDMRDCQRDASLCSKEALNSVKTVGDFWLWARRTFAPGLRADRWYNDKPQWGLTGYFNDFSSRIIGYGMLRQIRIKQGI